MNRIFHARIAWYQYFLLVVLTVNAVGALWCKYILVAVLFMLMLIVVIEQIIHTTYTLTKMVIWKSHVVVLFARRSSRFPKLLQSGNTIP